MTTYALWLAGAVLAQGAIALVLVFILGTIRVPMVASGKMPVRDIALSREPWPEHEKKVSHAFDNQFQLPVLFYVAAGLSFYFGTIWIEAVLAWLFVLGRMMHAVIFVTRNRVYRRFFAYTFGYAVLSVFWLELAARLVFIAIWNRT
jgi:hypothetical protein